MFEWPFFESYTSSSFRWPESFFHDLANACVICKQMRTSFCPLFVCTLCLFCHIAVSFDCLSYSDFVNIIHNSVKATALWSFLETQEIQYIGLFPSSKNAEFHILIRGAWTILCRAFYGHCVDHIVDVIIEALFNLAHVIICDIR